MHNNFKIEKTSKRFISLTQTPAIWDPELANPVTKNIVFPEVLVD
jgi:hypothetical protein